MLVFLASTLVVALSSILVMKSSGKLRVVRLESNWERLIWSVRINCLDYHFPRTLDDWSNDGFDPEKVQLLFRCWEFLRPFFASRGYTLYRKLSNSDALVPLSTPGPAPSELDVYPYARRIAPQQPPELAIVSERVWGARDPQGREVVIKLVSQLDMQTTEWKLLKRLNSDALRSDPRNHTIQVVEFVSFDNLVFAIMPRWDMASRPEFSVVSELMEYAKAWLEVLEFLHENRIAHQDFIDENTGMNIFGTYDEVWFRKGLRNSGEVRYALYDFGHSLQYEEGVDIYNVKTDRFIRFHNSPNPEGPYNPFKADVSMLGGLLELRVRHIENIVPDLGPFFGWMKNDDEERRPTASQALQRFLQIYAALSPEQLQAEVTGSRWRNGKVITKERDR